MIRILYDHQKFSTQLYGGISRYFANLIQKIKTLPDFEYQLGVIYSNNHYIKELQTTQLIGRLLKNPNYAYRLNKYYCEYLLSKHQFDIFHPTYYDPYFIDKLKKPLVITIHDMTYERLPEYFWAKDPLTFHKRLNIERADKIIAISETTKRDLLKYNNVDEKKIEVVYHGIDLTAPFNTTTVTNLPENYLLFVGDRSGYKNFYLFLNAFKKINDKFPEIKLVVTGGGKLDIAETEYIKMLGLNEQISHKNVSDTELNYVYANALAFVYPSLHEGFGLPILESFTASCPMLLSDTECFREIAEDAAIYFDSKSLNDLVNKLDNIISDGALRHDLINKGLSRLKDFSLEKSLKETLDIYKQLA
jgi:glycosyltransferase involved in cell wall biosynthesis